MIAHTSWIKGDEGGSGITYSTYQEGTSDMGMAEWSDPDTSTDITNSTYYRYPRVIHICNTNRIPPVWIDPCKFKGNNPRRPIDPTEFREHLELSRKRSSVYARRTAPNWKPRTALILRSNPRWRSGKWKAKT